VDVWIRVSWKGTVRITTGDVLQHSSHTQITPITQITQITQITPEALGYRNCGARGELRPFITVALNDTR
jgi:hypothetical protein